MFLLPLFLIPFFKKEVLFIYLFIYLFLEGGWEGEKEGEKYQCVVATHVPPTGTWPITQACARTGNRTGDWATPSRAIPDSFW